MFNKKILALLIVFLFGVMNFAAEIVLQNGLNGYNGCADTHLKSLGDGVNMPFDLQNDNYHSEITIETAN